MDICNSEGQFRNNSYEMLAKPHNYIFWINRVQNVMITLRIILRKEHVVFFAFDASHTAKKFCMGNTEIVQEIWFGLDDVRGRQIVTNCCTWHGNFSVVSFSHFWLKKLFRFWITREESWVKCSMYFKWPVVAETCLQLHMAARTL